MRMKLIDAGALVAALLCLSLAAPPRTYAAPVPALSTSAIDGYFAEFAKANRIPGLSVAVVESGKLAFCRGYGSDGRGGPMTPDTRLCLGSVSKSFTSLAVLQLAERGALDLDAPYKRYIPWFAVDGPGAEAITIRQLLTHTSGLDETGDPRPEIPGASLEDEVRSLAKVRPFATPGTRYRYYNKNYRALGYLVEKASGLAYGEYLRINVFEPLGMAGASADPAGMARGAAPFFGLPLPVAYELCPGDAPAGGLVMGAADAAKYLAALLGAAGAAGPGQRGAAASRVVGPGFIDKLRETPAGIGSRYGLGWTVEREGRRLVHGGDVAGFHAYAELDLDTGRGCVVLCRQNGLTEMLGCYDQLPAAVHALLDGSPAPDPREFAALPAILAGLALLVLAYQAWRFARLSAWVRKAEKRRPAARLLQAAWSFVLPGLLIGLPLLFSALTGLACTWADLFHFMPDLALLAAVASAAGFVRGSLRMRLLLGRRAAAA